MRYLKQSTAITLRFGPFLDDTDGKTAETGLTISQADIRLSKAGGAFAQTNDASGATHDENGWYYLQLDGTDTGTVGLLTIAIHESGALPVFDHFMVLPANVYDSLISGSDYLQVDVKQWLAQNVSVNVNSVPRVDACYFLGSTASATSGRPEVNVTHVSDDSTAADNLEAFLLGTGDTADVDLAVRSLKINNDTGAGVDIDGTTSGVDITASGGPALDIDGTTFGFDIDASAGPGFAVNGTSSAMILTASAGDALSLVGTNDGIAILGGSTGIDINCTGGPGVDIDSSSGAGLNVTGTTYDIDATTSNSFEVHVKTMQSGVITNSIIATGAIGASELGDGAVQEIRDAILADSTPFNGADVAAILADTVEIGTAGAGLTAVPWNSSWDAEVQSKCNDALVAINLDHLMAIAVANNDDMTTEVVDGTVLSNILSSTSDTSTFVVSTDSLQAIHDAIIAILGSTGTELTGTPGAAPDMATMMMWLYMRARNEVQGSASAATVANTAGTIISQADVSETGGTVTRAKFADP